VNGPFPDVLNESSDDWPVLIVWGEANGPDAIGAHVTVTVASRLSDGEPHCPVTRTQ
jgi:hypothetical protein